MVSRLLYTRKQRFCPRFSLQPVARFWSLELCFLLLTSKEQMGLLSPRFTRVTCALTTFSVCICSRSPSASSLLRVVCSVTFFCQNGNSPHQTVMRSKYDGNSGDLENTYDGALFCCWDAILVQIWVIWNTYHELAWGKKSKHLTPMFIVAFLKERCWYKYISKTIWEGQFRNMCLPLTWTTRRRVLKWNEDGFEWQAAC